MKEIWKDVKGYEGLYRVSDYGRINSIPGKRGITIEKILKPKLDKYGYLCISLSNKGHKTFMIHKLVLEAFIGSKPFPKAVCRHLDGNKLNNNVKNLQWGTCQENSDDMKRHNTQHHPIGILHPMSKLNEKQVRIIKYLLKINYLTQKEIGKIFNVSRSTIGYIKRNKLWSHIRC